MNHDYFLEFTLISGSITRTILYILLHIYLHEGVGKPKNGDIIYTVLSITYTLSGKG